MTSIRTVASITIVMSVAAFIAMWLAVESRAQAPDRTSIAGAWTLNADASDQPPSRGDSGDAQSRGRRGGGYGRGGGFGGRGGFGGGGRTGRDGGQMGDREEMARLREAMRDIMNPPDHLTITQSDSMVAITGPDGRTTRLAPDGKKVKDENTHIERKTRWDGGKLVSEISGIGPGKMTQTFAIDPEHHQLRIVVQSESPRPRTITHVYDADAR